MKAPIILREGVNTVKDLENLKNSQKIWEVCDNFESQLEELFVTQNPPARISENYKKDLADFIEERLSKTDGNKLVGNWIYFPWNGYLLHTLTEDETFAVRTNRNQYILTKEEQSKLYSSTVAMLGLSIGNGMVTALAYTGIAKNLKIADFDTLELSNLNRIRTGLQYLGIKKTDITAQQVYEINPYANLTVFEKRVDNSNLEEFVSGDPKPNVILEAIDDFEMKIRVRILAKQHGIPVIMLTNLGDRLLIDIERYDLDPNTELFNGLIGKTAEEILNNPITEDDKKKYAINIVGKENIPQKVVESVMEVNKTLAGRPQLMSTVTIGSGVAAFLVRKLILSEELGNGRRLVDFEALTKI